MKQPQYIKPLYKSSIPAIVFTIDDDYVPYFAVALTGLLYNSSQQNQYDIVILYRVLSNENMSILQQECVKYPNISIRFYNIDSLIQKQLTSNIAHINEVAFYRLYIPNIFALYDKIIFLDADICIDADIAPMYQIALAKNYLAAAKGCLATYQQSYKTCNSQSAREFAQHAHEILNMDGRDYFNAGVLIFNIKQILKDKKDIEFLSWLDKTHLMKYNDQDILNLCCKGRVKYFGCEWNYCAKFDQIYEKEIYDQNLTDNIKIYHFIGADKPWINKKRPFYHIFYTYALLSPFRESFLNK